MRRRKKRSSARWKSMENSSAWVKSLAKLVSSHLFASRRRHATAAVKKSCRCTGEIGSAVSRRERSGEEKCIDESMNLKQVTALAI